VLAYVDGFAGLYPIGRYGMHLCYNQDHFMLATDIAVTAASRRGLGKSDIWRVIAKDNYYGERASGGPATGRLQ
jgi:hypothetical protein